MKEGSDPQKPAPAAEPRVLLDAGGVVAIDKPPGLGTQAPSGFPSAEAWLRGRLGAGAYVGVPHRLDRVVSGVLLLATTPRAARKLSRQFERREIEKVYLGLVAGPGCAGIVAAGGTEWRDRIVKIADEPRALVASGPEPGGREAVTRVEVVAGLTDALVVRLEPLTGRMHQLRVQAASRGAPIVGDALYGGREWIPADAPAADPRFSPIALHAWRIAYTDPVSGRTVRAESPLPAGWPAAARSAVDGLS